MNRKTKEVKVGNLIIGGGFPISLQTMWKKPLVWPNKDILEQMNNLSNLGCDILRISVQSTNQIDIIREITRYLKLPLVVDVHFDYRIALECMDIPIAKIRINPGNIGNRWKQEEVIKKAKDNEIPIRVGINAGSLPKSLQNEKDTAKAMVNAAEEECNLLEKLNFQNVIFSLKSSEINATVRANEIFSKCHNFPLHLGVTEAGPLIPGLIKNTIALSKLLEKGIGDTIRISLSESPEREVIAGKQILKSMGYNKCGIEIISCPMCSRSVFDVKTFLNKSQDILLTTKKNITVAIMGCPVNGPGEAKKADLGITGAGKYAVIFKKGVIIKKILIENSFLAFKREIEKI